MISLAQLDAIIFDMDGVLWRGDDPQPGVPDIFPFLQEKNISYVFATNNSSKTPAMYVEKLGRIGVRANPDQIITSAIATAHYARETYPDAETVYIIGREGIIEAFAEQGFTQVFDEQADLAVAGFDPTLTYDKLRAACYQIQRGARFIGTNPDKSFPEPDGFAPGAGSILAALEAATDVSPKIVGKPYPPMFETALDILNTTADRTLMVGDRLETDIQGANSLGMYSVLLLSGISTQDDAERLNIKPDAVLENVSALLSSWQN